MYNIFSSKHIFVIIIRKALISILIGAFLFNDIAYAADFQNLAPKLRLTLPKFKEMFRDGYILLNHKVVNDHIASEIKNANGIENLESRNATIRNRINIKIVAIDNLFKKTGQFAHVGLGKHNEMPVVYIDKKFFYDEAKIREAKELILSHEFDEIERYELVREGIEAERGGRVDLREE
jgi:hypothetical protein